MGAHEQAKENVEESMKYISEQSFTNEEIKNLHLGKQDFREKNLHLQFLIYPFLY